MRAWIAAALILVGSCSTGAPVSETEVALAEFHVTPEARVLTAGEIEFDVENYGEFPHTFVVTSADGSIMAALDPIPPGEEVTLSVDLPPGTYQVSCRIVVQRPDGSLVDHYQQGMHAVVTVVGGS